ncbi:hypothetical protein [Allorhizocola rhizosphaerae]|uniref:hypothetical protein n=1 Tax=Allorhizocola rhizosphaerae TaxID=1872709 RepID=UPI000E3E558A|nr:hypothetical protein [Allorhizocola rhizosphaerae]
MNRQPALPRRPLTVGELLDAAVQLVRAAPRSLLVLAAGLAVAEQGVLYPLREVLGVGLLTFIREGLWELPFGGLWVAFAVGAGLEALIITFLGVWAGRAAVAELTGVWRRPGPWEVVRVSLAAPVAGLVTAVGAFLGPLWVPGYTLFGTSGAVIGIDAKGSLGRAAATAFRVGMRVTGVRLLGYLAWLLLRLGFLVGLMSLLGFLSVDDVTAFWILTVGFVIANVAAYSFLAALDAAAVIESRFRGEGLDIWLARAERHAPLTHETVAAR